MKHFSLRLFALFLCLLGLPTGAGRLFAQAANPAPDKVYRIAWHNNRALFITENDEGALVVSERNNALKQFWTFTPVSGQPDTYYVRNTASKRYIASCNLTPGGASRIRTTPTPTPYHVARNPQAKAAGAWYFSSTDCDNFDKPALSPRGLNKDGASSNVITWPAGNNNVGSYWWLEATDDRYELRPFCLGSQAPYAVVNADGKTLRQQADGRLVWSESTKVDADAWYFERQGAAGYHMVHAADGRTLNAGATYTVEEGANGAYRLVNAAGALTIDGYSDFRFRVLRSALARRLQIYDLPCVAADATRLLSLRVIDDKTGQPLKFDAQNGGAQGYTLFTRSRAAVTRGDTVALEAKLNRLPAAGAAAFLYFDWDHDGIFEVVRPLNLSTAMQTTFAVPQNAPLGSSRMRLRITLNGLTDADDETAGLVFDGVLNVVEPTAVSAVRVAPRAAATYDLAGRRVTQPAATGLYIHNGNPTILQRP